ncbi:virB8 family protein [Alloyangia pacifica]|uniref:virB8 family protein n=1 Tax=Alloyangia pacifica TaxID=311180 RepID=UPI001CFC821C|nr:VirB8/TrbF family protein [Alloyangia pacifica]
MKPAEDKEFAAYLKEARSFDYDLRLAAERSKRTAWIIAGVASLLAVTSVAAVGVMAPLKEVVPFVIRVDTASGVPEVMTSLGDGATSYEETVTRYFLARYVREREGYSFAEREAIYREVTLLSAPEEQARFSDAFNGSNPNSPQYIYGTDTRAEIKIRSISFLGDELAQVRFYKTAINERENLRTQTLWVATIEFGFDGKAEISAGDRTINPLGFLVESYRADPEVPQ